MQIQKNIYKTFLVVSGALFAKELGRITKEEWETEQEFDQYCRKSIGNIRLYLVEYFICRGQEGEDFCEDQLEQIELESAIMLDTLNTIVDCLVFATAPKSEKILEEGNIERNQLILAELFEKPAELKEDGVSIPSLLLVCLQTLFENFEDLEIVERKLNLSLVKKILIFMVEISENTGPMKIDKYEGELNMIFINSLGFLENKFYQYHFYDFGKHKHLEQALENRIRASIDQIKCSIREIFLELFELMRHIDSIGSMEQRSFYDLMKSKRKGSNKIRLKNFYPGCWKKADEHLLRFLDLKKEILKS